MRYAIIDCAGLGGKRDLHERLRESLELPSWYGCNLDALYDCLTEPGEPLTLALWNPQALQTLENGYGQAFLAVLEDAARDSGRFRFELHFPQ